MAVMKDLTGQRFGRLVVREVAGKTSTGNYRWICDCDCGSVKTIVSSALREGKTQSCGCIKREQNRAMLIVHGKSKTPLYRIWTGMKTRCYNKNEPKYKCYGGRGITVCSEWRDDFLEWEKWAIENGYKQGLTIDRIDVNGNYEPSNCRWADIETQQNNRRSNHRITYDGKTLTIAEWSRRTGLTKSTISHRLERGWSIEETLDTPMIFNGIKIIYQGRVQSISAWAREVNLKADTLGYRLRQGYSVEEALNTKLYKNRGRRGVSNG